MSIEVWAALTIAVFVGLAAMACWITYQLGRWKGKDEGVYLGRWQMQQEMKTQELHHG